MFNKKNACSNFEEILKHYFKEVFVAKNSKEAYEKYLLEKPDLLMTDIKMENESGIDLIKKVRKSDSKTRIIITSAHTDLDYLLQAVELHLIKYIIKPVTQDKLIDALEIFVNSYNFVNVIIGK